jgi:serine/threonine protein phosphatase PrpC
MWQIFSASTQGTSHLLSGTPCQDAHAFHIWETGMIAAVADGLGSASRSDQGAQLAIEAALTMLDQLFMTCQLDDLDNWAQYLSSAFTAARESLERAATSSSCSLREYGTTLIVLIIAQNHLAVGHLGDGAVVAMLEDGSIHTISAPERGEYANEVVPLTAPDALCRVRYSVFPITAKVVALLTDGLQNLCINAASNTPHIPFFEPFFEAACLSCDTREVSKQLAAFLNSERVCSRSNDDKTLVVIGQIPNQGKELLSYAKAD